MRFLLLLCLLSGLSLNMKASGSGSGSDIDREPVNPLVVGQARMHFIKIYQAGMQHTHFNYKTLVNTWLPRFEGLPYGASAVSCPSDKTLINFDSFDCVTFVETFWAMAYTLHTYQKGIEKEVDPFTAFVRNINKIRYFGGRNCGIHDRIHYWTQGLTQLQKFGLMVNVAYANGTPFKPKTNYLSVENKKTYSADYLKRTIALEKILNETPRYFYPKADIIAKYLPLAKDGDIVSFAAGEDGLDVTHTGIITVVDGELKVSHASSLYSKLVKEQDLMTYLSIKKACPGVFIFRPVFK